MQGIAVCDLKLRIQGFTLFFSPEIVSYWLRWEKDMGSPRS